MGSLKKSENSREKAILVGIVTQQQNEEKVYEYLDEYVLQMLFLCAY